MHCIVADLGVSTADGEDVQLQFTRGDLSLRFLDWQEQPRELVFHDVIAFRWQEFDESALNIRDDTTYEVIDSEWLQRQAQLQAVDVDQYAHYILCFNACRNLDVLARRKDS
jgi:hypothetical protein